MPAPSRRPGAPTVTARYNIQKRKDRKCVLCIRQTSFVDYKNLPGLLRFLSNFARILPRRLTGNCQRHQAMIEQAMKRARFLALLPSTLAHLMPEGKGPK